MIKFYVKKPFVCPHCGAYYLEEELVNVRFSLYGGEPTLKCEYCSGRMEMLVHPNNTVEIRK